MSNNIINNSEYVIVLKHDINENKKKFINVLDVRKKIEERLDNINKLINQLNTNYKTMVESYSNVKNHNHNHTNIHSQNYIFGMDGFLFQNKILEIKYNHLINLYKNIDNHIYYDYYKLYNMIREYMKTNCIQELLNIMNKDFPIYKKLENTKIYDISNTIEIHSILIKVITDGNILLNKQYADIQINEGKVSHGYNINTLVYTQKNEYEHLKKNIEMFINFMENFDREHINYLNELYERTEQLVNSINQIITY